MFWRRSLLYWLLWTQPKDVLEPLQSPDYHPGMKRWTKVTFRHWQFMSNAQSMCKGVNILINSLLCGFLALVLWASDRIKCQKVCCENSKMHHLFVSKRPSLMVIRKMHQTVCHWLSALVFFWHLLTLASHHVQTRPVCCSLSDTANKIEMSLRRSVFEISSRRSVFQTYQCCRCS